MIRGSKYRDKNEKKKSTPVAASTPRCTECRYKIRGANHVQGSHHKQLKKSV